MNQQIEQSASALAGTRVAVLGTGTMGTAAVHRLLAAGATVNVWNRSPEPARELAALGAHWHATPRSAVNGVHVVLTFLPTGDVTQAVMLGRYAVEALAPGAVWAQMGTIGIQATEALAAAVRHQRPDVRFVDAPVSGSRGPAEAGELLVLGSGHVSARQVVLPIFAVLGRRTLWLGPAGAGTRMKLVMNTWLAFEVEAAAEASALADQLGIGASVLTDAIAGSPLVSALAATKLRKIQAEDDEAEFSLGWALKDLELAQAAAAPGGVPVAGAISKRWRLLADHGAAGLDVSAARLELPNLQRREAGQLMTQNASHAVG
jgi:3-hydroxyisobutyrate dehydrogenase